VNTVICKSSRRLTAMLAELRVTNETLRHSALEVAMSLAILTGVRPSRMSDAQMKRIARLVFDDIAFGRAYDIYRQLMRGQTTIDDRRSLYVIRSAGGSASPRWRWSVKGNLPRNIFCGREKTLACTESQRCNDTDTFCRPPYCRRTRQPAW